MKAKFYYDDIHDPLERMYVKYSPLRSFFNNPDYYNNHPHPFIRILGEIWSALEKRYGPKYAVKRTAKD